MLKRRLRDCLLFARRRGNAVVSAVLALSVVAWPMLHTCDGNHGYAGETTRNAIEANQVARTATAPHGAPCPVCDLMHNGGTLPALPVLIAVQATTPEPCFALEARPAAQAPMCPGGPRAPPA
jgi:hypothetical protein